jgi:transmembrane sensor
MNDKKNKVFEFLRDEHFVHWVQNPTEESNHYWTKWISNHKEFRKEIEIARKIIQSGTLVRNEPLPEANYDLMLENIMLYAGNKKQTESIVPSWKKSLAIAASIILVLVSVVLIKHNDFLDDDKTELTVNKEIRKEAPFGSKLTTRLPDGSEVTLNAGSSITFGNDFQGEYRDVYLTGEAFFDVEHNPSKPFIVHFKEQQVTVLGTSFNIRAYEDEITNEVAVASGKVEYFISEEDNILLYPSERATHNANQKNLVKSTFNSTAVFGWKEGIQYFDSEHFNDIMKSLERWYGIEVLMPKNFIPTGTYSGQFKDAKLNEVLSGLSFIYRFDYEIKGKKVKLTLK